MTYSISASLKRFVSPGLALLTTAVLLAPCAALATTTPYVVKLVQQGSNVVASGGGAIDLTGLTSQGSFDASENSIWPNDGFLGIGLAESVNGYSGLSGPASFGIGDNTDTTSSTGDSVGINGSSFGTPYLFVLPNYVSGTALTSGATWDNASFASLGVTPGTYVWTWGTGADQSFTLEVGAAVVPEPAALGMFGLGVLLIGGFVTLRRRRPQS